MIALCSIFLSLLTIIFVKGCTLEGCEYQDAGSCGSACCRLSISILNETTTDVMNKLNNSITSGGPDFLYTPMMTAEGTLTFGDLRPYHPGEVDFIGQTVHTTINGLYNDTVNFLLKEASYGTEVYAFSISQTAGAYGDVRYYTFHSVNMTCKHLSYL